MAITGSLVNKDRLIFLIAQFSTKIQTLNYDILSFVKFLSQLTDQQLKDIFTAAGDTVDVAAAEVTDIRNWQAAILNLAENFTGQGTLSDVSFEVSKRYNPQI